MQCFAGNLLGLHALLLPKEAVWGPGQAWLLDIYDWDVVLVKKNVAISFGLKLCFGLFPCSLWIKGQPAAVIERQRSGYISCLFSDGCETLRLEGIWFYCSSMLHQNSSFKIQGSVLYILKSNFTGCVSSEDGGVIQSFEKSTVIVSMSSFTGSRSDRFGGAISAFGGSVHISDSNFSDVFAARGGGAVWSSAYQSCYGVLQYHDTVVQVQDSAFTNCTTNGGGGAILVSSDASESNVSTESLAVGIRSNTYTYCWSTGYGGAIFLSGKSVIADISSIECSSNSASFGGAIAAGYGASLSLHGSKIHDNTASESGGAISASYGVSLILIESEIHNNIALGSGGAISANHSEISLTNCTLDNNRALGFGGGALFLKETSFSVDATSCSGNQAPSGGGGVLLLQGPKIPSSEIIAICNQSNHALYGPCMASECRSMSLIYNYSEITSSWAGLPIKLAVEKLDAYQQIVSTDNSYVQVLPSTTKQEAVEDLNSNFSFVGSTVSKCVMGYAHLEVAIKPIFVEINADEGIARIRTQPYIYVQSFDLQTGAVIQSDIVSIMLEEGGTACPQGYVLDLDLQLTELSLPTPGACKMCKQGTYSLFPLAGPTNKIPGCFTCPSGAKCLKDGEIRTEIGNWTQIRGMLNLIHCPEGHTLRSTALTGSADLQECRPCLATQYILRPDSDACQNCPPGLSCGGTYAVIPKVEGSTWILNGSIYRLLDCPAGYSVSLLDVYGSFDATVQRCSPCLKGAECVSAPCIACTQCKPGFYKAAVSTDACLPCPANTFNPTSGGQALSLCQPCPVCVIADIT